MAVSLALANSHHIPAAPGLAEPALLLGSSPAIEVIRATIKQVAATDIPVLLRGESGTGKEVVARLLAQSSERAQQPWVKVNCAAIPHELLESELFGYEAGAFTGAVRANGGKFERAHRGTLFLDEIGEMPPALQCKLLHVLQDGEFSRLGGQNALRVDVRILAASNAPLEELIAAGRFRLDLYYRLNVVELVLPPLRERCEDVPLLLEHYGRRFAEQYRHPFPSFCTELQQQLLHHPWPGNVRELESFVRRFVLLGEQAARRSLATRAGQGELMRREVVQALPGAPVTPHKVRTKVDLAATGEKKMTLVEISRQAALVAEQEAIEEALQMTNWNRRQAARLLGISYKGLHNKLRRLNLGARKPDRDQLV